MVPDKRAKKKDLNNFLGYCLGLCAGRHGQELYAWNFLSNHYHIDVLDKLGEVSAFKQHFNSLVARGVNAMRGRFEQFWSNDGPCDTRMPTDEETLNDLAYTLANPVKDRLVKWGHLWPGFSSYGWKFGETRTFHQPDWFFDKNNKDLPESVTVTLSRPPIFKHLSDEQLWEKLMERVRELEIEAQMKVRRAGRRFLGLSKIEKTKWNDAPEKPEDRFTETPEVASGCRWRAKQEEQRNLEWEKEYAESMDQWDDGFDPDFPYGTYYMRKFIGVNVATGPP